MTAFSDPPRQAAWRHRDAREGFEVVFLDGDAGGVRIEGHTAAVEAGDAWSVSYSVTLDAGWRTRSAVVSSRTATGVRERRIEADGAGGWWIDGEPAAHLDGCLDVDLESSALTNAFPVRRLALEVGESAEAPAAYVRALDLAVERLEQRYVRTAGDGGHQHYDYTAPAFAFACRLVYDRCGLALDYPGIAVRSA